MKPHVTCIILNYNEWKTTENCISSLENSTYKNFNIILIDNKSDNAPKSLTFKENKFELYNNHYDGRNFKTPPIIDQQIYSIRSTLNGGFSYGINIAITCAIKYTNTDYFWILNNDTLCNELTLEKLINERNETSIIGSTLLNEKKQELRSIGSIHPIMGISQAYSIKSQHPYIPFTSVLISKHVIEIVGKLSEDYFLYFEDADFCTRAKEKNIAFKTCKASIVMHNESYTASKEKNKDVCPDWIPLYSKKLFMKKYKFHSGFITVSLLLSLFKRLISGKIKQAFNVGLLIFNDQALLNKHHYYKDRQNKANSF